VERFQREALDRGLSIEVHEFPQGTRTAEAAARAVGCEVAQIVKSLVFMAGGEPFVALTSGANRADTARLAAALEVAEVRRASPDEVREATGFAIGGTPPFGYPRPVRMLLDRDLLGYDLLWAAAGTPQAVFPISPDDLLRASGAKPADFRET
jgi:prolyl-tRNA editing enzyme YbaK/EbsC (Cys-tRNA(Pro) deacylase)